MAVLRKNLHLNHVANAHTSANRNRTKAMSIRPEVLYGSDFETNPPKDGVVNVWLWAIVRASDGKYIVGESIEEWYEYAMKLTGIICFHNLKFDGRFILDYLVRNNLPWCPEKSVIDAEMHIPYRIALKDDLYIQDTMRVHAGKLDKVAKSYGLEGKKEASDFTVFHEYGNASEKDIEYVLQDANIVAQILRMDCIENDGYIPMTGAGFALRKYVNWLIQSGKVAQPRRRDHTNQTEILSQIFPFEEDPAPYGWQDLARKSYMGGISLVKAGISEVVNGRTWVYDDNSAYPSHMANKPLPVGEGRYTSVYVPDRFGVYYVECSFVHVDTCPIIHKVRAMGWHLPYTDDGMTNSFTLYGQSDYINDYSGTLVLTSIEIDYLKRYARLHMKVIGGYTFDTRDDIFRDYIVETYTERQKIKRTNPVRAEFLKLMMNSLYGKFGAGSKYGCKVVMKDGIVNEELDRDDVDVPWCYPPVATAITGYQRIHIAETITANWDGFLYTDTDSIHLCKPHIEGSMWIDQKALGAMKCESISDNSKYIRPKCYVHINEREYDNEGNETACKPIVVKCGGMPDDVKKKITSIDDVFIGAEFDGKLMPVRAVGGVYLRETTYKITNSFRM